MGGPTAKAAKGALRFSARTLGEAQRGAAGRKKRGPSRQLAERAAQEARARCGAAGSGGLPSQDREKE